MNDKILEKITEHVEDLKGDPIADVLKNKLKKHIEKMKLKKYSLLEATKKHYEGELAKALATIQIYNEKSVGIGEHPQMVEELMKQVEIVTDSRDQIKTIEDLIENGF